jgi:hypothetical protein
MFLAKTSKNFPNYLGRKIRFSFNGYVNRTFTDDVPCRSMMVVPEAGKTPTMSANKKAFTNTTLVLWNLGWSSLYSLQMVTSLGAMDRNGCVLLDTL